MTDEKLFEKYYTFVQVAKLEGVTPATLANRYSDSAWRDRLPPMVGRGKNRKCLKVDYHKCQAKQLTPAGGKKAS